MTFLSFSFYFSAMRPAEIHKFFVMASVLLCSHFSYASSPYQIQHFSCLKSDGAKADVTTMHYPDELKVGGVSMSLISTGDMVSGKRVHTYGIDFTDMRATATEQDGNITIIMPDGIFSETIACSLPEYNSRRMAVAIPDRH
ncbi:hypothetical protein ACWKX9_24550 [Enterobacter asburiae]